jgi:hypothetical protein
MFARWKSSLFETNTGFLILKFNHCENLSFSPRNWQICQFYLLQLNCSQYIARHLKYPLTPMGVLAPVSAQRDTPLSPPSTSAEIFQRRCLQSSLKKKLKNPGGGGKIFKIFFLYIFSPNQAIQSTFRFFRFFQKKFIVVTMFACHLRK